MTATDEPRLFLSEDNVWCDRTKPLLGDEYEPDWFNECDPAEVCAELERALRDARAKIEQLEADAKRDLGQSIEIMHDQAAKSTLLEAKVGRLREEISMVLTDVLYGLKDKATTRLRRALDGKK